MKKILFSFLTLLLGLLLLFGCSAVPGAEEIAALREKYPSHEVTIPDNMDIIPVNITKLENYWEKGVTAVAVVTLTGEPEIETVRTYPLGDASNSPAVEVQTVTLPVTVTEMLAGSDQQVTVGTALSVYLGTTDFIDDAMTGAFRSGGKYVFFLSPSIGRFSAAEASESLYCGALPMYLTGEDCVLAFSEQGILKDYAGNSLNTFRKALQASFAAYQKSLQ